MKKKVRVKSLPKAQFAGQQPTIILTPEQQAIWQKNQGMFGANYKLDTPKIFDNSASFKLGEPKVFDNVNNIPAQGIKSYNTYPSSGSMPKAITPNMMGLNVPTKQEWEKQNGQLNITGDFFKRKKDFGIPTYDPSIPGSRMSQDIRNQEQTLREGEVASTTPPSILAAQDKSNYLKNFTDANSQNQKGNPYVGQAILAGTDIFRGLANQIDNRFAKRDLRDQFLSDNLAYAREEGQSGNRGDYNFNEFGFGPGFRPDDYIKGDYNKEAQMGGEMF